MTEEAQAVEEEVSHETEPQEIDLSAVKEDVREYVDTELYESDESYKRALDHGWQPDAYRKAKGIVPEGDEIQDESGMGYRTFNRLYDMRQQDKALKKELGDFKNDMKESMDMIADGLAESKVQAQLQKIEERLNLEEGALKLAMEDGDTEKAVEIQKNISKLEGDKEKVEAPAPQPQQQGEPPFIVQFRQNNPVLDGNSPQFDPVINAKVEGMYNASVQAGAPSSVEAATQLLADMLRFVQGEPEPQKEQRKAPTTNKSSKSKASVDPYSKLNEEQRKFYQNILDKGTKKHGAEKAKKAADNYAKTVAERG